MRQNFTLFIVAFLFIGIATSQNLRDFEVNPEALLRKSVVSTDINPRLLQGVQLRSGQRFEFGLTPYSDKSAFALHPIKSGDGITAYWLSTRDSIEVPAYSGPTLVITPQLDGCSLYVKYNPTKKTITVFHHYREEKKAGAGQKSLTKDKNGKFSVVGKSEAFDDVLAWEEYGGDRQQESLAVAAHKAVTCKCKNPSIIEHLRGTHATAFLWRNFHGEWFFIWQKFVHDAKLDARHELTGFKFSGFNMRRIKGIPPTIQKPPPAVTKPPKTKPRPGK